MRMKFLHKRTFFFSLVFLLLTVISPNSYAWSRPSDQFWVADKIIIHFRPYYTFGKTSVAHMNDALYNWNQQTIKVANRSIVRRLTEPFYSGTYPESDEEYKLYKVTWEKDTTVAEARTLRYKPYSWSRYEVWDADIAMNTYHAFTNGESHGFDFLTIFLHESGHTIGLNHSDVKGAVMYPTVSKGTWNRSLSQDDKDGVKAIYG